MTFQSLQAFATFFQQSTEFFQFRPFEVPDQRLVKFFQRLIQPGQEDRINKIDMMENSKSGNSYRQWRSHDMR